MGYKNEELDMAIQQADSLLAGDKSAAPMMKFIASAESDYGQTHLKPGALSYGPFQIDPIRYYDIAQNPERANIPRINKVNEFLRGEFDNPDFDISKLATYDKESGNYSDVNLDMMRNPLVGSMLTRMALMQDKGNLPEGTGNMADYYMDFWGPKAQTSEKKQSAIDKFNLYHDYTQPVDDMFAGNKKVQNAFPTK
jgi:hypothetical protein